MENLNSDNKCSTDDVFFYERLPRYVKEPLAADNGELSAVKRVVQWNEQTFFLTIMPACSIKHLPHGLDFGRRCLFPGAEEEQVEMALRRLCVRTNINFDVRNSALYFSFSESRAIYEAFIYDQELTGEKLEKSLFVLFDSNYVLKQGTKEYYFRAIERINWVEQCDEKYYRVDFSPMFFDRGELLTRLFGNSKRH